MRRRSRAADLATWGLYWCKILADSGSVVREGWVLSSGRSGWFDKTVLRSRYPVACRTAVGLSPWQEAVSHAKLPSEPIINISCRKLSQPQHQAAEAIFLSGSDIRVAFTLDSTPKMQLKSSTLVEIQMCRAHCRLQRKETHDLHLQSRPTVAEVCTGR